MGRPTPITQSRARTSISPSVRYRHFEDCGSAGGEALNDLILDSPPTRGSGGARACGNRAWNRVGQSDRAPVCSIVRGSLPPTKCAPNRPSIRTSARRSPPRSRRLVVGMRSVYCDDRHREMSMRYPLTRPSVEASSEVDCTIDRSPFPSSPPPPSRPPAPAFRRHRSITVGDALVCLALTRVERGVRSPVASLLHRSGLPTPHTSLGCEVEQCGAMRRPRFRVSKGAGK